MRIVMPDDYNNNTQVNNNVNSQPDTENFIVRMCTLIPPRYALVSYSVFGDKNYKCHARGLAVLPPWRKCVFVSLSTRLIDPKTLVAEVKDRYEVEVDYSIEVRVTDPIKYKTKTQNSKEIDAMLIDNLTDSFVKLIKESSYEDLVRLNIDLDNPTTPEINRIVAGVNYIEQNYGLKVTKLNIKKVNQHGEMSRIAEENARREIERKQQEKDAETNKKVKQQEADANVYQLQKYIQQGLTNEQALQLIMSGKQNSRFVHVSGDNNSIASMGAQFQAGVNAVDKQQSVQQNTNNNQSRTR